MRSWRIAVVENRDHVLAGGLLSYGADLRENYRQGALYVDRILRGAHPRDLPVVQGDLHCFLKITGQKSLIKALLGREHRIAAEKDTQELELRHIAPNDDEADGQGGGEEQPDRAPQRSPENRRHDDGQRRQARAGTIEPWLDNIVAAEQQHRDR